ncbi:MAG TPA: hypothetical protein VGO93_06030 [Candidatus Xenobia bacterium]|jgi:hypothetical protein
MKKFLLGLLTLAMLSGFGFSPAFANEAGKKHTTIDLGAAAAGLLLFTHHKTLGAAAGAAAVYSYSRYNREHQHNKRAAAYRRGYQAGRYGR